MDIQSSYHTIFEETNSIYHNVLSEVVSRVGLENAYSWNNTVEFKEDADVLIKMANDDTDEYEVYGIMSAEYGAFGLLLNDKKKERIIGTLHMFPGFIQVHRMDSLF